MQKFTRPLTREIELAGERLALTFSDEGIAARPVGSRKPPREISWGAVVCLLTGRPVTGGQTPTPEEIAAAIAALKKGETAKGTAKKGAVTPTPAPADAGEETTGAGAVATFLNRLEQWLAKHRRRYLEGLLPGASAADLEACDAALGIPLPGDLRALLTWHNGQSTDFVGHLERNFDLLRASQIVDAKKALDAGDRAQTGWQPVWIPFLQDDADNCVCLDTGQEGVPVREFWQGRKDHPVVAPSLAAWLETFVTAVEKGEYHEDPERGTFLRGQG
jgi:cell wall assembly regulator SMI1